MKYLTLFLFFFSNIVCSEDSKTVKATIIYIAPFPFAVALTGEAAIEYKQAAWIKLLGSSDSLAVFFDYTISDGDDIGKKIDLNKPYEFCLQKLVMNKATTSLQQTKEETDSLALEIKSLPIRKLVNDSLEVRANNYWLVLTIDELG